MRSFLFIINERARGGDAAARVQRLIADGPLADADVESAFFVDDEGIRRGLASLADARLPVAVGGDGTLCSVARILRADGLSEHSMGILPLGTGNGVAHSLGIKDLRTAVEVLLGGGKRRIDVMATTHPAAPLSLLSVSVGLESEVMRDYQAWRHRSRWIGAAVGVARHGMSRVSDVMVEADGQRIVETTDRICNVGLHNMPCYGFGVRPHPIADPADGFADVRLHRSRVAYWAWMGAATLRASRPIRPTIHPSTPPTGPIVAPEDESESWETNRPGRLRIQHATISTSHPVQIDGESAPAATFDVDILPNALSVLAP